MGCHIRSVRYVIANNGASGLPSIDSTVDAIQVYFSVSELQSRVNRSFNPSIGITPLLG